MSRCKACDRELTSSEMRVRNRFTKQPEDLCKTCRAIGSDPDAAETDTQPLCEEIRAIVVPTPIFKHSSQHSEGE